MTENPADFIPIGMILSGEFGFMSGGFGFIVGELCGDYRRHRHCLQQANDELRERLEEAAADSQSSAP